MDFLLRTAGTATGPSTPPAPRRRVLRARRGLPVHPQRTDPPAPAWALDGPRSTRAVALLTRRGPTPAAEVAAALGLEPAEALHLLRLLQGEGRVALVEREGWVFRSTAGA